MPERTTPLTLIIDDESSVRTLLSHWLSKEGYPNLQAESAAEARVKLRENAVDIVTLDLGLPDADGLELLHEIRKTWPDIETILFTGRGGPRDAINALNEGATGFITKPCAKKELVSHFNRARENVRLRNKVRLHTRELEQQVDSQTKVIRNAHEETIHRLLLASLLRDEETGTHIRRIGLYSSLLAEAAGWPEKDAEKIRLASPMHDVGKIGIPDAVLQKPGRLNARERSIIEQHTIIGSKMLSGSECEILQMAEEIALSHHEKWDGTGYPYGLRGDAIPVTARMVSIVDVYDALTHNRIYRPALTKAEAVQILRNGRGRHFDADFLDLFLDHLPKISEIAAEHPEPTFDHWQGAEMTPSQEFGLLASLPR